jgi:TonB family protein
MIPDGVGRERRPPTCKKESAAFPASATRFATTAGVLPLLVALAAGCGSDEPIQEPTPLYGDVPIDYPLDLWDANVEGVTLLRVRVTEMGVVDSVEVLEGSGYPAFDSAAVRGALDLRYNPARKDGERTTVWAKVPVHFTRENR